MSGYNTIKHIYLFGYSGHAYVVIESILSQGNVVAGYFDKQEAIKNPFLIKYCGNEEELDILAIVKNDYVFPAIGNSFIREKLVKKSQETGILLNTVIDKTAFVARASQIGMASFVAPHSIVGSLARIGVGCIINSGAIIEHECVIGNFTHIAPGAVLAGNVIVGNNSFVGANSVIKEGVIIGSNVVVGAGAVVISNIPDFYICAGNPAKRIK